MSTDEFIVRNEERKGKLDSFKAEVVTLSTFGQAAAGKQVRADTNQIAFASNGLG